MDGTSYFARPVTVTDERIRDAMEKQAKQRALREALDSQVQLRGGAPGGTPNKGMTKAQLKRQEAQQAALEREQQQLGSSGISQFGGTMQGGYPHPGHGQQEYGGNRPYQPPHAQGGVGMGAARPPSHDGGGMYQDNFQRPMPSTPRQGQQPIPSMPMDGGLAHPLPLQAPIGGGGGGVGTPTHHGGPPHQSVLPPRPQQSTGQSLMDLVASATDNPYEVKQQSLEDYERMAHQEEDHYQPQQQQQQVDRSPAKQGRQQRPPARASGSNTRESRQRGGGVPSEPSPSAQRGRQQDDSNAKPNSRRDNSRVQNRQKQVAENSRVQKLEKDLLKREQQMSKMLEKERGWEKQVTDLKQELKHAKQKERELNKLAREKTPQVHQQRAETAPMNGSSKGTSQQKKHRQLQPIRDDQRPSAPTAGKRQKAQPQAEKPDHFNETLVDKNGSLRPITAPNALDPIAIQEKAPSALPPLPNKLKQSFQASGKPSYVSVKQNNPTEPQSVLFDKFAELADSQIITSAQAQKLWEFLGGSTVEREEVMRKPTPPLSGQPDPNAGRRSHQFGVGQSQPVRGEDDLKTYETYAELEDDDTEGDDDGWCDGGGGGAADPESIYQLGR